MPLLTNHLRSTKKQTVVSVEGTTGRRSSTSHTIPSQEFDQSERCGHLFSLSLPLSLRVLHQLAPPFLTRTFATSLARKRKARFQHTAHTNHTKDSSHVLVSLYFPRCLSLLPSSQGNVISRIRRAASSIVSRRLQMANRNRGRSLLTPPFPLPPSPPLGSAK